MMGPPQDASAAGGSGSSGVLYMAQASSVKTSSNDEMMVRQRQQPTHPLTPGGASTPLDPTPFLPLPSPFTTVASHTPPPLHPLSPLAYVESILTGEKRVDALPRLHGPFQTAPYI